jgi:hypothetical protein
MKTFINSQPALFSLLTLLILAGCSTTPHNVPFPGQKTELAQPVTKKLHFSEAQKINWRITDLNSVKSVIHTKFELNKLPSQRIDNYKANRTRNRIRFIIAI